MEARQLHWDERKERQLRRRRAAELEVEFGGAQMQEPTHEAGRLGSTAEEELSAYFIIKIRI